MGSHTTEEQLTVGLSLGTGVWADGYVVLLGLGELRVTAMGLRAVEAMLWAACWVGVWLRVSRTKMTEMLVE